MKLIRMIVAHLFGKKYYANISFRRGVAGDIAMCSYIFRTRKEARKHAEGLETNASFGYIETVSFRSRIDYD